jgi:anti-sigma factor RsiW
MHSLVKEHLEELLDAQGIRTSDAGVDSHLAGCHACRRELDALRAQAVIFQSLRPSTGAEPHPGFYARLMDRIEAQQRPNFWGAFLEPGFSRRIVFASLIFLVLFGGYLASSERAMPVMASGPEVIMADTAQTVSEIGSDPQQDRDAILATLTTYQE